MPFKKGTSGNPAGRPRKESGDEEETRLPTSLRKQVFDTLERIKATKTGRARRKASKLLLQYRRSRRAKKSNILWITMNESDSRL